MACVGVHRQPHEIPTVGQDDVVPEVVDIHEAADSGAPETYSDLVKKVALLESAFTDARKDEQAIRDTLEKLYDTHADDVTNLESQLSEYVPAPLVLLSG